MDVNKNRRDGQDFAGGGHPATSTSPHAHPDVVVVHGGKHPGTKPRPDDRERKRKKRQRQSRKKNR